MNVRAPLRGLRLSTRLGLTLTGILVLAAVAQAALYFKTRDETIEEADASYRGLAKAIELAATQVGPEGWKDQRALRDFVEALRARGLRDIQITEAGRPFPPLAAGTTGVPVSSPTPPPRRRGAKPPPTPHDILISGVVGEGQANRTLQMPIVVEGRLLGYVKLEYEFENIRGQLADNFRRRLYALLGVFALGLGVVLVLTRNATKPVHDMAEAANQIADGMLEVRVEADRDDEIGQLAATFNRMAARLREQRELELRLAAAEKRAEIGHLASGLAHEIKNPLNALSLGLDVLKRRHRPAEATAAEEYAARIEALREEINRLATLTNSFLSYGRPLSLTLAPLDLGALVATTLDDLAETAERAHVSVLREIPASLPPVYADGSLVKSAVWNLVQNGVQSMERAGGTLRVSLAVEEGTPPSRLVLALEDTGGGIDPGDLHRLFEPYFSRREGGVGLGLAMVRRIVEDHGGRISAENRADGVAGALFRLWLPLAP